MSRVHYVLEWTLVGSIPHVYDTCIWLPPISDIVVYVCKIIACLNFQWINDFFSFFIVIFCCRNVVSPGSIHPPRQQAPPRDDCDDVPLHPIETSPTVIEEWAPVADLCSPRNGVRVSWGECTVPEPQLGVNNITHCDAWAEQKQSTTSYHTTESTSESDASNVEGSLLSLIKGIKLRKASVEGAGQLVNGSNTRNGPSEIW